MFHSSRFITLFHFQRFWLCVIDVYERHVSCSVAVVLHFTGMMQTSCLG